MARVSQQTEAPTTIGRVIFRWFSGRDLDGLERTDSTFRFDGTVSVRAHITRPSRWSRLAGWKRSAVRNGGALLAAGSAGGWALGAHRYVIAAWVALGWWALAALGLGAARWAARRSMFRTWVQPTHAAVAALLGRALADDPWSYLTIPADFATNDDAVIRVDVPDAFAPELRPRLVRTLAEKLALGDVDPAWHLSGRDPFLTITRAPAPPANLPYEQMVPRLLKAPEHAPILGLGPRGKVVDIDLKAESPHIALSAGTGGGKSVIGRLISMQILANGGLTVVADIKRVSQRYLKGLPGVAYCRTTEEIHHAILAVAAENDRRYAEIDIHGEEHAETFARIFLLLEELNGTMNRLQKWWESTREKSGPKRCPSVDAIGDLLFMGRQSRITVLAIAQMLTANAIGGPAARENFATRILARYSVNNAKMLAPEIWPFPRSSRHPGRVQVVIGGIATAVQVIWTTEAEARAHVLAGQGALGRVVPMLELSRLREQLAGGLATAPDRPAEPAPQPGSPEEAPPAGISLAEACAPDGVLGTRRVSLDSARKATTRDPAFPATLGRRGTAHLYDPAALRRWATNRERQTA